MTTPKDRGAPPGAGNIGNRRWPFPSTDEPPGDGDPVPGPIGVCRDRDATANVASLQALVGLLLQRAEVLDRLAGDASGLAPLEHVLVPVSLRRRVADVADLVDRLAPGRTP
jgi:hypothetical protein